MLQTNSDEQLMSLVCKGDRTAFEMLYDRYFDKLVWYAYGFINDRHRSEDVIQDIFMKLIEKPEQFHQDKRFSTWIYTVTGNACKNILRNEQNRQRILRENFTGETDHIPPHHQSDARKLQQRLHEMRNSFNEKEKNIYALRFEQELTIREIATITSTPEGTVKSGIYYLLKKIATQLKDFTHE